MAPIRVLVVDDSVVIRRLVSSILDEDPDIEVVGTAVNGRAALQKVEALSPDIVTMDVEMPEMNGIEAVRALRARGDRVPVVMFSTLTERGAAATFDALAAGASDYVPKPANVGSVSRSMEQVRQALVPLIKSLAPRTAARLAPAVPGAPVAAPAPSAPAPTLRERRAPADGYRLLVVGSSTGGPEALFTFLTQLGPVRVPVLVVQHMPPVFTQQFAARLDRHCPFPVSEARDGVVLAPGTVTIARGDHHLEVERLGHDLVTRLTQDPPENYCRPAVDVLFRTAATAARGPVLGVVLTGMGQDGARGAQHLVDSGGSVIAQDRATSVVWGMPGAVAAAGLAEQLLPLPQIAGEVRRRLATSLVDERGGRA